MPIERDLSVDEVMRRWPMTIRVFLTYRMGCIGCPIARFHTVTDACGEHHVDEAAFLRDLCAAAGEGAGAWLTEALRPARTACAGRG